MKTLDRYLRDIIEDPTTHHRKEVAMKCLEFLDETKATINEAIDDLREAAEYDGCVNEVREDLMKLLEVKGC